ncbi:MAG: tRNA (adenosine(37)-N6)-threonylcarbamoyltransferase complex dimerization subunit type 1 TsaB [bacterium]
MTDDRSQATLLAIDCSQREAHLVLASAGGISARSFDPAARFDRELLWDELRALLADAGASVASLSAVAVATGPGGFTGLRVAVGCAKGIAFARGIPVIEIPSAIVFAASDRVRGGRGPWLIALAVKNDTAWVVEAIETPSGEVALLEPEVAGLERCTAMALSVAVRGGALLADEHLGDALSQVAVAQGLPVRRFSVDPSAVAREALARLARGVTIDPFALSPIYAREPEAVTKWRQRALSARPDPTGV